MPTKKKLLIFLLLLFCPAPAPRSTAAEYPFANPYWATVAGSPADMDADTVMLRERVLTLKNPLPPDSLRLRHIADYAYSLAWRPEPAPLIFIIPGTGSNYTASKARALQKACYDAGMHAVCLNSTFNRRFAVMGCRSGIPGLSGPDAADLLRLMRRIRSDIRDRVDITEFRLAGYSLGGLTAAFAAARDEKEAPGASFDFSRVLLINPPVNLLTATGIFDRYIDERIQGRPDLFLDELIGRLSPYFERKGDLIIDEDFLYYIRMEADVTDADLRGVIGIAFRLSLANMVFTADLMTGGGRLIEPGRNFLPGDSTTPYFKVALGWKFTDYLDRFLIPLYRENRPESANLPDDLVRDALAAEISLPAIADFLRNSPAVALVHNADDIILGPGDMAFLRSVFNEKARIYPRGGHLGNMSFPPNLKDMMIFLKTGNMPMAAAETEKLEASREN